MNILANSVWNNPAMILLLIVICFGAIAGLVFLIRKVMFKNKQEEKPNEEDVVKENLDRFLEPVEDEYTKKEFEKYENKDEKEGK